MKKNYFHLNLYLVVIVIFFVGCNETFKSYYPTLKDAENDGAIIRGWIPKIIPSSAKEIIEQHNIDTNEVWIKFKADKKDFELLLGKLTIIRNEDKIRALPYRTPNGWWEPTKNNLNLYSIAMYNDIDERIGYFFIDSKKTVGYYSYCSDNKDLSLKESGSNSLLN